MAQRPEEGIYRRVSVKMWGDEKVRRLTAPPPCGQSLWVACIAGRQTTVIPGVFEIGEAAWAEQLGWSVEGFREAFDEVFGEGLVEADWKARLVWVKNGVRHNAPASPNVVLGWRVTWELLPECSLKCRVWEHLYEWLKAKGKPWVEAFAKACPKPSPHPSANQEAGNRKQETGSRNGVGAVNARPARAPSDAERHEEARGGTAGGLPLVPDPEKGITRPMLVRLFPAFRIPDELHEDAGKLTTQLARFERKRAMSACEAFLQRAFTPGQVGIGYLVAMCEQNAEPRSGQPRFSNGEREFTDEEKERFRRKHQPPRLPPAKSGAELDAELLARARAEVEAKGGGRR